MAGNQWPARDATRQATQFRSDRRYARR